MNNRINILFLNWHFTIGGVETATCSLINNFNVNNIFNVFVLTFKGGVLLEKLPQDLNIGYLSPLPHENINGKMFNLKNIPFFIIILLKLCKYIKVNKIDVIHTMDPLSYFIASVACRVTGIKHIRTQPNFIRTKERLNAKTFKWTPFAKWTDFFITYQFYARDDLHKLGVPLNKIYVQKNRFDIRKNIETPITSDIRKEFGWDKNVKIVCSMSRLVRGKGLETFVEMIPHVVKEYKNVKFLILGEGPIKEELIERCKELGVYSYVLFPGFRVDKENIAKQVTLGVYPTADTAGMADIPIYGNVLISKYSEAMEDYIVDRKTGYLIRGDDPIDYAKAVITLLEDDILREEMQKNLVAFYSDYEQGYFKNSIGMKELEGIIINLVNDNKKRS